MNKNAKKLQLHRDTLHNLSERNLREVVGGISLRTCYTWTHAYATCDCSLPQSVACCTD